MQADIGLILEGTYPYIRGGVSSWVHQIIKGLPEFTFSLMFIGDKPESYPKMQYELPANVLELKCFYIMDKEEAIAPKACKGSEKAFEQVRLMHKYFHNRTDSSHKMAIGEVLKHMHLIKDMGVKDFLYSEQSWSFIKDCYEKSTPESSFLDYFWNVRSMHKPIFALLSALDQAVDAKFYHSISTGYAGLFGLMLHHVYDKKLMLTEHGIYTKERKIDLSQIDWIGEAEDVFSVALSGEFSYLRKMWIHFFEAIGHAVYDTAEPIIAISEGNRLKQVADGADAKKTRVIPNGIDLPKLAPQRAKRPDTPPLIVGFIGRVVPIKDVKTFLRAMRNVCSEMPSVQAWIVGGEEEDRQYAEECREMIVSLHLTNEIIYKGFCNVAEILPQLGCVVLSSISEGVPLVILEAFACGIPVIATDVGACRELIEGGIAEDKALGAAGIVVPIADAEQLGRAVIKVLSDFESHKTLSKVAEQRADTYFSEQTLFKSYQQVYTEMMEN